MESTKIQIKPLSCATDWPIWKRRIRDYMDYHEGALDVIDGKLLKPELPESPTEVQRKEHKLKADQFRKANSYAKSVIANAVTEDTYQKIMDKDTAREVWEELKRNFEASSKDQLFQICSNFFSFDWLASVDVSGQVAKLKMLWNELNNGLQAAGKNQLPEMLLVCKVMHILPSSFQTFKSSWLMLSEDKHSLSELVTQLCVFEREINADKTLKSAQQDALVASTVKQRYSSDKPKPSKNKKKVVGNCNYCHGPGHWVKQCSKWIADGRPAKNAASASSKTSRDETSMFVTSNLGESFVTQAHDDRWFVDNGATKHITKRSDIFVTFEKFATPHRVQAAGKEVLAAIGKGTVKVISDVNNSQQCLTLLDVWYVPSIGRNLFSVLAAQDKHSQDSKFESTATKCCLSIQNKVVMQGTREVNGTLYESNLITLSPDSPTEINVVSEQSLLQLYHERFGHQDKRHVKAVIEKELNISVQLDTELCESCIYGKAHRLKFGRRQAATKPGELLSADVCGPLNGESFSRKSISLYLKIITRKCVSLLF